MLKVLRVSGFLYSIEILKGNTSLMQFQCTLKFPFSIREREGIERKFYFSSVALLFAFFGFPPLFIQELRGGAYVKVVSQQLVFEFCPF